MALLRIESFDHWATADAPKKGWTLGAAASISAGNGRNSTSSLRVTNTGGTGSALLSVSNSGRSGIIGFGFRCPTALPSTDVPLVTIKEGATTHIILELRTTGALRVYRVNTTNMLASSAGTPISGATYYFVEFAWNINDSSGSVEVKVNGSSALSATGVDSQNTGTGIWSGVQFWGAGSSIAQTQEIDDLYVAGDNTFRGDHRIVCVIASAGNGSQTDWTPSTGTDHGAMVDEATPNITDYVSSGTAGQVDTFNFAALGVAGTVAAAQVSHYVKADVAGIRQLANVARIGGVNYASAAVTLGSDWTYSSFLTETSPDTSAAWTVAEIDGAEFGPKVAA